MIKKLIGWIIAIVVVGFVLLASASRFLTDWAWFDVVNYSQVFWITLKWEWGVWIVTLIGVALFLFINLRITKKSVDQALWRFPQVGQYIKNKHITLLYLGLSIFFGVIVASGLRSYGLDIAVFFNQVPFNIAEPLFGRDVSFYIFSLPILKALSSILLGVLVMTGFLVGAIYILSGNLSVSGFRFSFSNRTRNHLVLLAVLFLLVRAASYLIDISELLLSPGGAMFGAGYTDVYVRLLALRVSMIVAVLLALALIIRWRYQRKLIVGLLGAWIISGLLLGGIVPTLVQNWIVEPNEFEREREFLQYHIEMTRTAYGLDKFVVKEYPATPDLTYEDIDRHRSTVDNVRLWDPRVLLQTYGQLQEMRPYYRFSDVDVARYWIDGEYRQVMISARELVPEGLQTQSWINRHLQYTHGIGVVMNPSNEISRQRLPEFWISDIPPKSSIDIEITQPRIYFGERTNDYVIVNTLTDEFDYPMENRSATYRYSGADGVKISSFIDRLAFAFRFGNSRILLSTDITNESRILFDRNIFDRVKKIAPFLRYDQDPFVVVVDGRLKWIMDAYTVSTRFPYSEPTKGWGNYIRNSVKVVIDAYDGTVDFYQVEPDPIIEAYEKVFPGLVKPFEEMPENVRAHIRYPEDLLTIQALLYGTYHMNDRSFYNREDVWQLSRETYRGKDQEILPYYVIMDLPDEEPEPELVLMVPYTPARRPNMSAWLAARNDGKHYGEVIVYRFPIETSIWGPAQIEARIDQDPEISQLITLWSQSGSQVIRGNLLVLPIGEGILYVEPLYIQADQTSMPQLQRVIVAYGDDLVMADSLENAFVSLFGQVITSKELDEESISDDFDFNDENIATLSNRAHSLFIQAEEALTKGNFHLFGDLWNELREVLNRLNRE